MRRAVACFAQFSQSRIRRTASTAAKLAVSVHGGGPDAVLFLHGLGCRKENFYPAMADERLQGMTRIAVDLPGHGDSSHLGRGFCTMESMADLIRESLVEHMPQCGVLHIVAHSMGGAPGLLLAGNPPCPVGSFLNVEGNLIASDCGILSKRTSEMSADVFRDSKFQRLLAVCRSSDDPSLGEWATWAEMCNPDGYHEAACSLVSWSERGSLLDMFSHLNSKKCYLYGQRSLNPEILFLLDGIQTRQISHCGHFVMAEKGDQFIQEVVRLVQSGS
jgi:pimeloyl-ACP methyl ester carboxylesterase